MLPRSWQQILRPMRGRHSHCPDVQCPLGQFLDRRKCEKKVMQYLAFGSPVQRCRNGRTAQIPTPFACDPGVCARLGPGRQRISGSRLDPKRQRRRSAFCGPQTSAAWLPHFTRNPGGISTRKAWSACETEVPRTHSTREWPETLLPVCGAVLFGEK
jgi:hypothetical protein